jgi:hypothetical protein
LSAVTSPAPEAVYQTARVKYGDPTGMVYLVTGLSRALGYSVRLHFSENYFNGAAKNRFDIAVNGNTAQAFSNFDIYAEAGAMFKAVIVEFNLQADADGQIEVRLTPQLTAEGYNCSINGIELLQA